MKRDLVVHMDADAAARHRLHVAEHHDHPPPVPPPLHAHLYQDVSVPCGSTEPLHSSGDVTTKTTTEWSLRKDGTMPSIDGACEEEEEEWERYVDQERVDWEQAYLDDARGKYRRTTAEMIFETARLILPHVGLVLLTCLYTVIGASIFWTIESRNEVQAKAATLAQLSNERQRALSSLWKSARNSDDEDRWRLSAEAHLNNITDELFHAFHKVFLTAEEVKMNSTKEIWTLKTSIFFAVTVVTTIGYGNPVPITLYGRLICIFFALFGIPLTLVTIADIGKFFSEHLIWLYGKYLSLKHRIRERIVRRRTQGADGKVCDHCHHIQDSLEEKRIPATLVLAILISYTALGGLLISHFESRWGFFVSFYYSFITMTTVGFGDYVPEKDEDIFLILLYIIIGLAITTMCIDLVGVQYIRKIHYFGRKIQDARSALAIVGGKVVLVSELYAALLKGGRGRGGHPDAFIIENLYLSKHIIPFIPRDIKRIRYIDEAGNESLRDSLDSLDHHHSCRFCHTRVSTMGVLPNHGAH